MRHELHLTVRGLRALAAVSGPLVLAAAFLEGPAGAASAAVGAGLVAANGVLAALSTGWARTLGAGALAAGYAGFVLRMFAMFVGFALLARVGWIHGPLLAIVFVCALIALLGAECWSYARSTYVPRWRVVER